MYFAFRVVWTSYAILLSCIYLTCIVFVLDNNLEEEKKRLCSASSEKVKIQRRLQCQREKQMDLLLWVSDASVWNDSCHLWNVKRSLRCLDQIKRVKRSHDKNYSEFLLFLKEFICLPSLYRLNNWNFVSSCCFLNRCKLLFKIIENAILYFPFIL